MSHSREPGSAVEHHGHANAHAHTDGGRAHAGGHVHGHGRIRAVLEAVFVPHSHDVSDSMDDALVASGHGVRAVKISLVGLLVTAALQAVVVALSGSVALLADTIHNLADAMTAVPLWIAFLLGRKAASRRYTFGFGRAEDLAGLFIVLVIALSAGLAAWHSIDRIVDPQPLDHLGWVIAAGVVGFIGNEAVAIYRIRIGRKIGSAALVADGVHARTDGLTSLAVVFGGIGVMLGVPLADPIVGLAISAMIIVLLIGTIRDVGRRLMDAVEPELVGRAEHALGHVEQITAIEQLRLRWVGHRLHGDAVVVIPDVPLAEANMIAAEAQDSVKRHLPNTDVMRVHTLAGPETRPETRPRNVVLARTQSTE